MYAVVTIAGSQFRVQANDVIQVPTLASSVGEKVSFDQVLLTEANGVVKVGAPVVAGASVSAEVLGHGKGTKVLVFKKKRRKGYRKKNGHRQGFTEIKITTING